ncbi:2Fe-2S ferredoxin YfaE [Moellerella wisconsensis]|nr:2Fe-2S ferredoxin YfaE [Moellerella wisconsensis]
MSSHKITLRQPQGVDVPFHSELHDSLLEALEDSQIAAEYQCREGYCGSCRSHFINWQSGVSLPTIGLY